MDTFMDLGLSQFRRCLKKCSGKRVALDTETTGLIWSRDRLTTISFHCPDAGIEGSIDGDEQKMIAAADILRETLALSTTMLYHNAKFDMSFLNIDPNDMPWNIIDTTVMIHLIDSRYPKNLGAAEKLLLGENTKREHVAKAPPNKKIWDWPPDIRQAYNINDCRVTYQLAQALTPLLRELKLVDLFKKDMKYIKLLYGIEHRGMLLDLGFCDTATNALTEHVADLEQKLYDACGKEFNWRSSSQMSAAIYEGLGIKKPVNPFIDRHGVDRSHLKGMNIYNKTMTSTMILMEKAKHPLGELISSLREAAKLLKVINQWRVLVDTRQTIHTNFNVTGTRTGRLSSSKPNLQNVPSETRSHFTQGVFSGGTHRTEEYNLRNAFKARPGKVFVSVDYKQMEIRAFAVLAQDEIMLAIVMRGADVHRDVAETVWGVRDDLHREHAKTVSFGMLYGMSAGALMVRLGMTKEAAMQVTQDYWRAFPRTKPWTHEIMAECKKNGFIRYWSGRLWREEVENDQYKGVNAAIQGGCADLLSIAALRADKWLSERYGGTSGIVSLIHDELLMEIPTEDAILVATEVKKIMQVPDLMGIPFLTDVKIGDTYGHLNKIKIETTVKELD